MFILTIMVLSLAIYGTAIIPIELARRANAPLITSCSVPNTVALTFDDGPYIYLNDVVDTLKQAGATGTFFFNGDNWSCIYDNASIQSVQYAYSNGFQIGSHTWAHKDLTTLSQDDINSEMARTEEAIQRITGAIPAFTRPPYGSYNDLVLSVAGSRGQKMVTWDFDSGDSLGASVAQQESSYDDIVNRHPSTVLSLEHETYDTSVHQVLPYAIEKLQAAGYTLVTLAECLGESPYQVTGNPSTPTSDWHC